MIIAQQLYEGIDIGKEGTVGLVTYIRTDSVRSSDDAVAEVREYIGGRYGGDYLPEQPNRFKTKKNAQDAHEAIRPTSTARTPESLKDVLTKEQLKLYKLIFDRFVASQMSPMRYTAMSVDVLANNMNFHATGSKVEFDGFTAVYTEGKDKDKEEEDESKALPELTVGEELKLKKLDSKQHFTEPPARYTEASLVKDLEERGIGRPSTYAPTIGTILQRKYIEREGRSLLPTELGKTVVNILKQHFADIVDYEFTANMENNLDDVEYGKKEWIQLLNEFYGPFKKTLDTASKEMQKVELPDKVSDVQCEKCGAMMVYKDGKFGTFLACPNYPECKNTKKIIEQVGINCPLCGSELLVRTAKKTGKKFYGCSAYPQCTFISRDKPAPIKCPKCGSYMVQKWNKDKTSYYLCSNKECGEKVNNIDEIKHG